MVAAINAVAADINTKTSNAVGARVKRTLVLATI